MTSIFSFENMQNGPQFDVDDCKLAAALGGGAWGAAQDVPSINLYVTEIQTVNAQLEGDARISDTHGRIVSARLRLRMGGVNFGVLSLLTGRSAVLSGSTPNRRQTLDIKNENFPYFGVCAQSKHTQGGGDTHIFLPKVKVMEGFTFQFEYGAYTIPEITAMAIVDEDYQDVLVRFINNETVSPVVIPPLTS